MMKTVALHEVKDDLSKYLRKAEHEEIVITRHGKAAGILTGFASDDDWFDYRLENDPRFLKRVERAREQFRKKRGIRIEDIRKKAEQESYLQKSCSAAFGPTPASRTPPGRGS